MLQIDSSIIGVLETFVVVICFLFCRFLVCILIVVVVVVVVFCQQHDCSEGNMVYHSVLQHIALGLRAFAEGI